MNYNSTFHRSPKKVLSYYYITHLIILFVILLILSVFYYFWYAYHWSNEVLYFLIAFTVIFIIYFSVAPFLKYKYFFYKFEGDSVILKRNFIVKKEALSKIERLQCIDMRSNPLAKIFKIISIKLITAGHEIILPMVTEEEAVLIEQQALLQLKGVDEDV